MTLYPNRKKYRSLSIVFRYKYKDIDFGWRSFVSPFLVFCKQGSLGESERKTTEVFQETETGIRIGLQIRI